MRLALAALAALPLLGLGAVFAMTREVETRTFTNVVTFTVLTVTQTVSVTTSAPPPPPAATASRVGVAHGVHFFSDADNAVAYSKLKSVGVNVVRFDIFWGDVEKTKGTYDWSSSDRLVNGALSNGIVPLPILNGKPSFAFTPADYASFCRAFVQRYSAVSMVEVWNEPEAHWGSNGLAAAIYGAMLRDCSAAIKAVRSVNVVGAMSSGLASQSYTDTVLAQGPFPNVDAWAVHPYVEPKYADVYTATNAWSFEGKSKGVHDYLASRGHGKPIWITEVGGSTTSGCAGGYWCTGRSAGDSTEAQQASRLDQMRDRCLVEWAAFCHRFIVFAFRDSNPNRADYEANFGLLRVDGSEKPAWAVLR